MDGRTYTKADIYELLEYKRAALRNLKSNPNDVLLESLAKDMIALCEKEKGWSDKEKRDIASTYREIGVQFFNRKGYRFAVDFFHASANYLEALSLREDEDNRNLAKHYIELHKTYLELHDSSNAKTAYDKFIQAFNNIRSKSQKELAAYHKGKYDAVLRLYEEVLSDVGLRNGLEYQNQEQAFGGYYTEVKMVDDLLGNIGSLNMGEASTSSTNQDASTSRFSKNYDYESDRILARKYCDIASRFIKNNEKKKAVETYRQALSALKNIADKAIEDHTLIQTIESRIQELLNPPVVNSSSSGWGAYYPATPSSGGLFGNNASGIPQFDETPRTPEMDDDPIPEHNRMQI